MPCRAHSQHRNATRHAFSLVARTYLQALCATGSVLRKHRRCRRPAPCHNDTGGSALALNAGLGNVTVYVYLLDEGVDVWRPIQAKHLGGDEFEIMSVNPDPESESWQFHTGDRVRCKLKRFHEGEGLVAYELVQRSA